MLSPPKIPRRTCSSFLLLLFLAALLPAGQPAPPPAESRIEIPGAAPGPKHRLTLPEIVLQREIEELAVSPDGRAVALLLKQASIEKNDYRTALLRVDASSGARPVKLLEEKSLSGLRWAPDGRSLTYLFGDEKGAFVWSLPAAGGKPKQLFSHASAVSGYEWSPNGDRLAFLSSETPGEEEKKRLDAAGIVYDDRKMNIQDVATKSWIKRPTQLWLRETSSGKTRKLWESDRGISAYRFSPDGRKLAVQYGAPSLPGEALIAFNSDIAILTLEDARRERIASSAQAEGRPAWSPDGRSIAFHAVGNNRGAVYVQRIGEGGARTISEGPTISSVGDLWWSRDGREVLFHKQGRDASGVFAIPAGGGATRRVSAGEDQLDLLSLSADGSRAACRRQNLGLPPEVALLSLEDGSVQTLTELNPEFRSIELAPVEELSWENKLGYQTNGFFIKPAGYQKGKRYPFLLILYGFSKTFVTQAQWISSFPAQVFASEGFAVLLMNYPRYDKEWRYGDFREATMQEAWNPLASIEKAVELVTDELGIADPERRGIMGWSYGSFLTDFTISHAPDLFRAASSGEGGLYDDGLYWISASEEWRKYQIGILGGPPYGETYKNYQEISPALNAARVRAALLKEYESKNTIYGLQLFSALRTLGKPVEMALYPDEAHIFFQPKHRISSMQRNLDWMNFWLLGKEDPAPEKREQYRRWNELKKGKPSPEVPSGSGGGR
jgi:dipeptidyl aminopeptidase/acylaminoacyl peptidase